MKYNLKKFKSVEEYLKLLSAEERKVFSPVWKFIKSQIPNPTETIGYNMPAFKYKNKTVLYVAAFKDHFSLFPTGIIKEFENDLKNFKHSKGTIQFTKENLLPNSLIKKIVLYRLNQIDKKKV